MIALLASCGKGIYSSKNGPPEEVSLPGCQSPFAVTAEILSTPPFQINQTIRFRISASYCPNMQFQVRGMAAGPFLTSTEVTKSYPTAGAIGEAFIVDAYQIGVPTIVNSAVATSRLDVQAGGGAGMGNLPTCEIVRENNSPIADTDRPMIIRVKTTAPQATATLNGAPVVLDNPIGLPVVQAGTGVYVAQAVISSPTGSYACNLTVRSPVCSLQVGTVEYVSNQDLAKVKATLQTLGPAKTYTMGATTGPIASSPMDLIYTVTSPPLGTGQMTVAVLSDINDRGSCTGNYNVAINTMPQFTRLVAMDWTAKNSSFLVGANEVVIGAGNGAAGTTNWNLNAGQFAVNILDFSAPPMKRVKMCDPDEVAVGRYSENLAGSTTFINQLVCRKLLPQFKLRAFPEQLLPWDYNANSNCQQQAVLIGNEYSAFGSGAMGVLKLYCAQVVYTPVR